ncbi:MAG TPA: hypothetical protein VFG83_05000 [Kofleriaceae bacterium]|nr:hypothetical protein [Kofleriaceae bacterium]
MIVAALWMIGAGCGGGGIDGEPLVDGELHGDFQGEAFTVAYGFERPAAPGAAFAGEIFLGDSPISCADDFMGDPRLGYYVAIALTSDAVGVMDSPTVQLLHVTGPRALSSALFSAGTLEITASDDATIAASLNIDYTSDDDHYSLSGQIEVIRCPE